MQTAHFWEELTALFSPSILIYYCYLLTKILKAKMTVAGTCSWTDGDLDVHGSGDDGNLADAEQFACPA